MKSPSLIQSGAVSINMTPMIDVVFLLIIFFLVSSHLAKQENSIELKLPVAQTSLDETSDGSVVVLNVLPDGSYQLAGAAVDVQQMRLAFRSRSLQATDGLRLKIRTDENVVYEVLEPILRSAAEAGIGDVVFSVYEDPAGRE